MWWKILLVILGIFFVVGWIYGYVYLLAKEQEWSNSISDMPHWAVKWAIVLIGGPIMLAGELLIWVFGFF